MDAPFPFGLPFPVGFYLTLYLVTLVLHVGLMNYVLAGSAYWAGAFLIQGQAAENNPLAKPVGEWLSFMLGATITAGIGPLLFLQILYRQAFYTSNLLLSLRWLAILPALIIGFYLLYLLKAGFMQRFSARLRGLIGAAAFLTFLFVAWSFVENHLLSLQGMGAWTEQYASGSMIFTGRLVLPRLALWVAATFPTLAMILGWQLWYLAGVKHKDTVQSAEAATVPGSKRTAMLGLVGLAASISLAIVYYFLMGKRAQEAVLSPLALPYLIAAGTGMAVQAAAWVVQFARGRLTWPWMSAAAAGLTVDLLCTGVVGESTRLAVTNLAELASKCAAAMQVGGTWLFIAFLIINASLIATCVWLVRRGLRDRAREEAG